MAVILFARRPSADNFIRRYGIGPVFSLSRAFGSLHVTHQLLHQMDVLGNEPAGGLDFGNLPALLMRYSRIPRFPKSVSCEVPPSGLRMIAPGNAGIIADNNLPVVQSLDFDFLGGYVGMPVIDMADALQHFAGE